MALLPLASCAGADDPVPGGPGDVAQDASATETATVEAAAPEADELGTREPASTDPAERGSEPTSTEPTSSEPTSTEPEIPHDDAAPTAAPEDLTAEPAEGFEEIAERLTELPGTVEALVVEEGEVLLRFGQGDPAPLASVSKIYVFAALMEAIEAGDVEWMDQLELTDDLRSLPSGTLQDQPEGFTTTVYDAAHRMISLSDNTGTDMLMDRLGRQAVEEAVAATGHHNPQLLRPFLSTRELFQLRWGLPELGQRWGQLDVEERREVLEELSEEELEITSDDTSRHDRDEAIDWYATAEDVAEVTQALADWAQDQPEAADIFTANPGLAAPVEDPWWDSLAFKGGGLPGVVTGSWHAQVEQGAQRTVVMLLNTDDTDGVPEHREELFSLALDALIAGTETEREDG